MPLTVLVRSAEGARLTFDGTQRVVIGRGAGSDVRLPDTTVSLRHASLRAQGQSFVVVDEGSTNGTFVGSVRVAALTSRIIRSGDLIRVGRVCLEVRVDQSPVTRDVAAETREMALALIARSMELAGADSTVRVEVVEGPDQGAVLRLAEVGKLYVVGRALECDLALADADVSREHVRLTLQDGAVTLCDLGGKNGTRIGDVRAPAARDVVWRPAHMMKIGRTVLALVEPLSDALADIERAPDERLAATELSDTSDDRGASARGGDRSNQPAAMLVVPTVVASAGRARGWSATDRLVMAVALGVLALSLAGLVWLLRG